MPAPSKAEALKSVTQFAVELTVGVVAIVAIDAYAAGYRDDGFADPAASLDERLALTLGFFAAVLFTGWLLLGPRRRTMATVIEWMYDEAPQHTLRAARQWCRAVDKLVNVCVGLGMLFVGANAVRVLALWYPTLESLTGLAWYAWWFAAIGLLLMPLSGGFLFQGVYQQFTELRDRDAVNLGYRPRSWADLFRPNDPAAPAAVAVQGPLAFDAGGLEWDWKTLSTNCIVFGQPGSGKTACVLNAMLEGLIGSASRAGLCPGGLVLDPKGDFGDKLRTLLARHGWEDRLKIIDPSRPYHSERWNPLDSPDDHLELSARVAAVMDAARDKKDGGNDSFWLEEAQKFVRHSIVLLRATNDGEPPGMTQVLELARSFDAINERIQRLPAETSDEKKSLNYFVDEWMVKAEENRSGVQSYVSNMLDPFSIEPYESLFSGRSTVRIADAVRHGQIVYLRMPVAEKETMARVAGTFLKLEFYREVLKAVNKERPSLFFCDEFQVFMTTGAGKGDAEFFERNRQSNHVNLIATQNLPALTRHTPNNKEPAMSLLGNCATKMFLRNTDQETNKYASDLFGQEVVTVGGRSVAAGGGRFGFMAVSTTANDQYDQVVRVEVFPQLAIPSHRSTRADYCEAIIHAAAGAVADRRKTRWPLHPITTGG